MLTGCTLLGGDEADPAETLTPAPTQFANTEVGAATPSSVEANPSSSQETINLIIWTIPEISPRSEVPGGSQLAEQLNAYDIDNAQVNLEVLYKSTSGQGSILSYLRAGRGVADGILPDIVLLPTEQLAAAAEQQLIFPMDDLLPADALTDLYPAALDLATVGGRLMGYPFAINSLAHLVYRSNVITGTLPTSWTGLVETDADFVFPAAGPAGGAFALQLYLNNNGSLVNDAGQTSLQREQLIETLQQLEDGRQSGLILFQSGSTSTLAEAWDLYASNTANINLTTADDFLVRRRNGDDSNFAPIPGPNGTLDPLIKGWVWAVSTADPARQAQAIELISWLTNANNLGGWSQQSGILPASRTALASWEGDPYLTFLAEQLERAAPYPVQADTTMIDALTTAIFDLISLAVSPQEAADQVIATVRP